VSKGRDDAVSETSYRRLDNEKSIFNYRLSRARRVVENAFGILTQKFQIYQMTLQSLPENADNIIFATCILHNYPRVQVISLSDRSSPTFEAILQ
jgi:hypothetical protein